jgi:hypothetical protein
MLLSGGHCAQKCCKLFMKIYAVMECLMFLLETASKVT